MHNGENPPSQANPGIELGSVPTRFQVAVTDLEGLVQGPDGPAVVKIPHLVLRFETPVGAFHFFWPAEKARTAILEVLERAVEEATAPRIETPPGRKIILPGLN